MTTKFNRLTYKETTSHRTKDGHVIARFICDCGKKFLTALSRVKSGSYKSCGCLNTEAANANLAKANSKKLIRLPRIASAKRVHSNRYSDGNLSFEEFLILSQKDCFYCGKKPSNVFNTYQSDGYKRKVSAKRIADGYFIYNGLDRIDPTIGHYKKNVVPCCFDCNTAKLDRTVSDFLHWIKQVYQRHFESKSNDFSRKQSFSVEGTSSSDQGAERF